MSYDPSEDARRRLAAEINAQARSREDFESQGIQVWDTQELQQDFEVMGFGSPFVVVRRRSDGQKGSLEFQHDPRLYFNFESV